MNSKDIREYESLNCHLCCCRAEGSWSHTSIRSITLVCVVCAAIHLLTFHTHNILCMLKCLVRVQFSMQRCAVRSICVLPKKHLDANMCRARPTHLTSSSRLVPVMNEPSEFKSPAGLPMSSIAASVTLVSRTKGLSKICTLPSLLSEKMTSVHGSAHRGWQ